MFVQIYDIQFTIYSSTVSLSIEGPNDPTASFIDDDYKAICAEGQRRCGVKSAGRSGVWGVWGWLWNEGAWLCVYCAYTYTHTCAHSLTTYVVYKLFVIKRAQLRHRTNHCIKWVSN